MKDISLFEALLIYSILKDDKDETDWVITKRATNNSLFPQISYKCKKCGLIVNYASQYCPHCGRKARGIKEDE